MKNKIIFLLITGILLVSANAYGAAVDCEILYKQSPETDLIRITGTSDVTSAGEEVTLIVLKKGKTFENLNDSASENIFDTVRYTAQTVTGEGGSFSFLIPADESFVNGMVYAGVGGHAFDDIHTFSIIYISDPLIIYNAFRTAQTAEGTAEMTGFINNYKADLGLNTAEYAEVSDGVLAYLKGVTVSENEVVNDIFNAFNGAMLKEMLKNADSTEKITSALNNYDNLGSFDRTDYNALLAKGGGADVVSIVSGSLCVTPDDAIEALNTAVFLELSNKASNKEELQSLFEKYNQKYIGIQTGTGTSYANADKGEVFKNLSSSIQKNPVYSVSDYIAAFNSSIPLNTGGNNQGNAGGGGGGGGVVGETKIEVEIPKIEDDESENLKIFDDLSGVFWAEKSIYNLVEKNIISKASDNKFRPYDKVTREEYVKMLVTSLGIYDATATVSFTDVTNNAWYVSYLGSALEHGIIKGISEAEFGIGRPITREDIAVMTVRAAKLMGISLGSGTVINYTDADSINDYAEESVKNMSKAQIINGYEDGSFRPKNNTTRAEAAVILERFLQLQKGIQ